MTEKLCLVQWTREKCIDHRGSSRICLIKLFVHIKCIFILFVYVCVHDHVYVHMCMHVCVCEGQKNNLGLFSQMPSIFCLKGLSLNWNFPKHIRSESFRGNNNNVTPSYHWWHYKHMPPCPVLYVGLENRIHILMLVAEELYQQSYLSLCPKIKSWT